MLYSHYDTRGKICIFYFCQSLRSTRSCWSQPGSEVRRSLPDTHQAWSASVHYAPYRHARQAPIARWARTTRRFTPFTKHNAVIHGPCNPSGHLIHRPWTAVVGDTAPARPGASGLMYLLVFKDETKCRILTLWGSGRCCFSIENIYLWIDRFICHIDWWTGTQFTFIE